jgi:hypothetical protein
MYAFMLTPLVVISVVVAALVIYVIGKAKSKRIAHRKTMIRRLSCALLELAAYYEAVAVDFRKHLPHIRNTCSAFDELMNRDQYFRNSDYIKWKTRIESIAKPELLKTATRGLSEKEASDIRLFLKYYMNGRAIIDARNAKYVDSLKTRHAKVLNSINERLCNC